MPEIRVAKIALHVRSEPAGEQVLKRIAFSLPAGRQVGHFFVATKK